MAFHKDESQIKSDPVYMNATTLWQKLSKLRMDRPTRLGQGHVDGRLEYLYNLHPVRFCSSLPVGPVFGADTVEAQAIEARQARLREAEQRWRTTFGPVQSSKRRT